MGAWIGIGVGSVVSLFSLWMFELVGFNQFLFVGFISFLVTMACGEVREMTEPRFWGEYFAAFALIGLITVFVSVFI